MRRVIFLLLARIGVAAVLMPGLAHSAVCNAVVQGRSGEGITPLLELYTSEGCDSCPPVDRWLSALDHTKHGAAVLAFHVDYWDYLGWKDRFARPEFAARQRDLVRRQGSRTVYTPQLMVNGRDARAGMQSGIDSWLRQPSSRPARVAMAMNAAVGSDRIEIELRVSAATRQAPVALKLFLAVTEGNLHSRVTAGENRGSALRHDHVVREWVGPFELLAPAAGAAAVPAQLNKSLRMQAGWRREAMTVVAVAEDSRTGDILQSLPVALCQQ